MLFILSTKFSDTFLNLVPVVTLTFPQGMPQAESSQGPTAEGSGKVTGE